MPRPGRIVTSIRARSTHSEGPQPPRLEPRNEEGWHPLVRAGGGGIRAGRVRDRHRRVAGLDGPATPRGQAQHHAADTAEEVRSCAIREPAGRRAVQHAKAFGCTQAGGEAAELPVGGRVESPQGAAGVLHARRDEHGRQRGQAGPAICAAEGRQPAVPGEGGRLPGPELRPDHEDHRDRDRTARDRSGCSRRMDRAARHAAAAGEGAMNQQRENLNMLKWRLRAAALLVALAAPLAGWAQNTIQAITSSQQGGSEVVRIELAEPLGAVPAGFTVQAPPRVALDLPGIGNSLGRSTVEINQGNLRSVSVAQAGDRTRLVFNLKQAANYRAEVQGKVLVVVLEGAGATATAGATSPTGEPTHFAASQNREQLPLKDIDFRRGPDGAGRVVVGLANTQVGVDIRQQGQSLVVEFLRSSL